MQKNKKIQILKKKKRIKDQFFLIKIYFYLLNDEDFNEAY